VSTGLSHDDGSAPPVYSTVGRIERWLRDEIATEALQPGDRLPSMTALQDRFGAKSLSTVRAAQQRLIREGRLEPVHGVGVFVRRRSLADPDPDGAVVRNSGPIIRSVDRDLRTITICLSVGIEPPLWNVTYVLDGLQRRWPDADHSARGEFSSDFDFTIDADDLEFAVSEFDCLVADANADYLTAILPQAAANRQKVRDAVDWHAIQSDAAAVLDHLQSRAGRLQPGDPGAAARLTRAVEAVTTAQVLRIIHTHAYARPTDG
jgi:DNA-binding transcriptional regulator YhcF (GntR family)